MIRFAAIAVVSVGLACCVASAQNPPASDPQAVSYAAQSIAAMAGGVSIGDVTLTGTATWNQSDTGTVILWALGKNESRMDLTLTSGTRSETRDAQTGVSLGRWTAPNQASGNFAFQNCRTDSVWFYTALGSLAAGPNVVLTYIGQESRNGATVQHIQSYLYQSGQVPSPTPQQLSTTDFYLDASTFLPVAVTFNAHPDKDATANLLIEVDFSNYQTISGVVVPMHIQRYQQGNLMVDIEVSEASFNSGLSLSTFSIN